MHRPLRRALTTSIATVGIVALTAGTASAHFCYRENLNPTAAAANAGNPNWVSLDALIAEFLPGLCPAGADIIKDAFGASGDVLIHQHSVMAGGNVKQGKSNPAISHLAFPESDAEFEALVGQAFAECTVSG